MISIEELTVEIARQRDVLKRIEALVWYEPDDEDDLVEAVRAMACERDEARRDLGAILAVIHRDGGHHTGEFGVSQSVADAHATWAVVVRERDEARAERDHERTVANEQLARAHDAVRERDEARAEVERLRGDLAQTQELVRLAKMITSGLQNERDEVRAEVERLRAERDKQIAEAASWRATARDKGSSSREVARERDEARAEVERLRGQLLAVKQECAELREYAETVGLQAVIDASETYKVVVGERDIAEAEVERLRARVRSVDRSTAYEGKAFSDNESSQEDLAVVASERDEARSERERLRRERDYALAEVSRRDREHGALVETAQKALAHVAAERDEARAEVERLRSALAQAQRADE